MLNFIHIHIYMICICVDVCHEFDIEICMCHQCEHFVFVFVFLCPLPAARVCKNVPHVFTKWGKVVDSDGSGGSVGLLGGRGFCVCRFAFEVCQRGA